MDRRITFSLFAALLCGAARLGYAQDRVQDGLQALYEFNESSGDVVHDTSEAGQAIDLQIDSPGAIRWRNGSLFIETGVIIRSIEPARRLSEAIRESGELTLEGWVVPANDQQAGPARIVSLSADTGQRNFTLGQDGSKYDVRLRTTTTDQNGNPSTPTDENVCRAELTHVVYTRDAEGTATISINGTVIVEGRVEGDLSGWDDGYHLLLANEQTGDRVWLGELHLVAIYDRALSADEIAQNFAAGLKPAIDYQALLPPAVERPVDFVVDVQPILRERCFECHAQGNEEGGLNLGIRSRVMEGGDHGPVILPGDSANSRIIHLVSGIDETAIMPPEGDRLTAEQIGILRAWIDQGADWPSGADVLDPRTERAREHWAFQPLQDVSPPAVAGDWPQTEIDHFILVTLEAHQLQPSAPADARTLVRRMYFDMIGLPPTPEEMADWSAQLNEGVEAGQPLNQEAVARLADHLLSSTHYGERWGRHWLDVARYADSDGYESDHDRPGAYHYRDFVIRALNDDLPFNTFLQWQLAGNELEPNNPEAIAATGFLTAGCYQNLPDDLLEIEHLRNRYNVLDDTLSTFGQAMLGLTIGCARCHDHKYDAISAREYYRLLSALHSGDRETVPLPGREGEAEAPVYQDFSSTPATTWLFERSDFYDRDQPVQLGFLDVLTTGPSPEEYWQEAMSQGGLIDSTYQRAALADWVTDVEHGAGVLAARVAVNRVWKHHFGEGLARSVSDFGVRGELPTHPELLEWLTADFVNNGWSLKRLHRQILTSAVYQQDATIDEAKAAIDPTNQWLWRMQPRRVEAEIVRDAMLAVSGTLNTQAYGPAFKPPIAGEAMIARNVKDPYPSDIADSPDVRRRSVYMFHKRVVPYPLLEAFDRPAFLQSCSRREESVVVPQALALLNDGFVRQLSFDFADRLLASGGDDGLCVNDAFQIALGREPTESEQAASIEFIASQVTRRTERDPDASPEDIRRAALADYCQAVFSLNEFIYVD
jgi:hypothetical protein